ncbi:MAG: hypothetical protein HKN12_03835 [Gemmatimonadetes bacterium]|nr:hypothetical protein [Gemmatimonadota bacterium]
MNRRGLALAAGAAAIVVAALLATDVWPGLRGPENWQWQRRVFLSPWLLASVAVFAVTLRGAGWFARVRGGTFAAAALIFAQMVLLTAAEPQGLARVGERVESPSFTSYDTVARGVDDPREFLKRYPRIQDRFPVHGPSQPPGRVLYFWTLRQWLGDGAPPVAGFLLMAFGAMTVVPLATLGGRRRADPAHGPDTAHGPDRPALLALMACLPAYLLFTPQTDHLILFLSVSAAAALVAGLRAGRRGRAVALGSVAGICAGLGVFVSFTTLAALGAWGLAVAGMWAVAARQGRRPPSEGAMPTAAAALTGFVAVTGVIAALGLDWIAVFRKCTEAAHRVQVLIHGREYSTWVVWNLVDFTLFLGVALAMAVGVRIRGEWRAEDRGEIPFATALLVAVLVLDVSGKILGETGRIWVFLMPLAVAAAASLPRVPIAALACAQFLLVLALRAFLNVPG